MAAIYKPKYTKPIPEGTEILNRKGTRCARFRDQRGKLRTEPLTEDGTKLLLEQKKWRIEYTDANGVRQRVAGYTDRKATEQLAAELERRAAHEQTGLVDKYAEHRKRPLDEHVAHWHDHFVHKGTTQKQADQLRGRVLRVIEGCGFRLWPDLSASKVQAFIAELRNPDRKKGRADATPGSASVQTKNFYLQAVKQFCRWMVQDGRAPDNPLAHLKGWNVRLDRRHDRRALTDMELRLLLDQTARGPSRLGMTGPERALLYRLAVETGLRAGEIRSLTRRSLDLEGQPPTITVTAAYSKRRREDMQPVPPALVGDLRGFVAKMQPDSPVFRMPRPDMVVKMLRADLTDARSAWIEGANTEKERQQREKSPSLEYRDEAGRVADFHALRHTFITNLARAGVHPKQAQDLARHSDINLTMSRYSHTLLGERAAALELLPDLRTRPDQEPMRATGTDGMDAESLRTSLRGRRTSKGSSMSSHGNESEPETPDRNRVNPAGSDTSGGSRHDVTPVVTEADDSWRGG